MVSSAMALKNVEKARHTWPEELPSVLWSIRTTPNTATQETPFFLVHGAEAVLPIEIEHDSPRVTEYDEETSRKAREDDMDALDEARDEVLSRVTKYQQDLKNHSRRLRPRSFQVGDLVLRLNQQSTEKLESPWLGPETREVIDEERTGSRTRRQGFPRKPPGTWRTVSLESDLQKRFEHHDPHELMKELKTIFKTHAAVECYEASKQFFSCMMEEGSSVSEHMLAMTGHAKKLSDLGIVIPNRLGINRVLQSLPPSYKNFVMNYNMQNMNKELPELFGMLKAAEIEIKKEHQVLMVNKTTSFKKQGKSKENSRRVARKLPRLL
ncbi:hypothetical protein QYE76_034430 [Lolium multiflorum]|uniref:Retrotransposon gag domain-containing protein n=1 Tax=Lolium multiflorum TaxID=4521 RepID=A0AAD8VK87_LOLMU|nr:hypothetical protein QYE76_034430 [Lolium multiflorum]